MNIRTAIVLIPLLGASLAIGCAQHDDKSTATPATTSAAPAALPATGAGSPQAKSMDDEWDQNPTEKFEGGAKAFARVKDELAKSYYAEGLTDDDLYRAAVQGMLEHVDPKMHKWNKLLSPSDLAEIRRDLKGELVGVGVQISFEQATGYTAIVGIIPGTPAEKVGIVTGDLIVSVNGKLYKGMSLRDVVNDIRGKVGEAVTLTVLRGDKLVPFTITRELITYDSVSSMMLPDGIGYLKIRSFNEKTVAMLKTALTELGNKGAKALVVDLRHNQGGLFDEAIKSAELFLPSGTGIVTLKKKGMKDETFTAKGTPLLATLPLSVLVNGDTASGAELLTAALQEGRHASVIGSKTFGKWTLQNIDDELGNGYAVKFTVGLFQSPAGRNFQGTGLVPDIEVAMDEKAAHAAMNVVDPDKRIAADPQLRTATTILRAKGQ